MEAQLLHAVYGKGEAALGLFRTLAIGVFILAVPVALITTNIRVAISEQSVYDYSVRKYHAADVSGVPESELIRANSELGRYLTTDEPGQLTIDVRNGQGQTAALFNARETAHMADVRDLVQFMFAVQTLAVALALTLATVMLVLWPPRALAAAALYGAVLTSAVLGMAAIAAMSGFEAAWSQFHVFAFSNDLWQLDPDADHLIQMFPEAFWQKITMLLGAVTLLEAAALGLGAGAYIFFSRPRDTHDLVIKPVPALPGPGGHQRAVTTPNHRYVH